MPNFQAPGGTWTRPVVDIWASEVGKAVRPITVDATYVDADANGDQWVYEGTTMEVSPMDADLYKPSDGTGTVLGVAANRANLRTGDAEIGMVAGGRLFRPNLIHNGTFGEPAASSQAETDLRARGIYLEDVQI